MVGFLTFYFILLSFDYFSFRDQSDLHLSLQEGIGFAIAHCVAFIPIMYSLLISLDFVRCARTHTF